VVHRDVKPANVILTSEGGARLVDFGLAKHIAPELARTLTHEGALVGTLAYMAPEQLAGGAVDARADIWALGVLIYEMVAGRKPFTSSSLTGVLTAHITEAPKPPIDLRPEIGREINAIVLKCLEKDPKDRYKDAGALLHDLDQVQVGTQAVAA
jgi:serine/threonine-protein kinase